MLNNEALQALAHSDAVWRNLYGLWARAKSERDIGATVVAAAMVTVSLWGVYVVFLLYVVRTLEKEKKEKTLNALNMPSAKTHYEDIISLLRLFASSPAIPLIPLEALALATA